MDAKYIVVKHKETELMFTFPNIITHSDMLKCVQTIRVGHPNWERIYRNVKLVSAGFIDEEGFCHSRSESLNIGSRPEDTALFKNKQMRDLTVKEISRDDSRGFEHTVMAT